jgi:uncharacterized Zn finger protein (UPF0148 family)
MSFTAQCSECDEDVELPDEKKGKNVKCPSCGKRFSATEKDDAYGVDEEAEEEERARAKKKKKRRRFDEERDREVNQIPTPMGPMIWAVLAVLLPCGLVGLAIGGLALTKVQAALSELPAGRRADSARSSLKIAQILCFVGLGLSLILMIVGVVLTVTQQR